jgi:carboxyl-terminal processing protease
MTTRLSTNRRRPSAAWLAISALSVALLALGSSSRAPADTAAALPGALAPTDRQRMIARRVGSILEEAHFRKASIDDTMSGAVFDKLLNFLDGQRSYLLAADVAEFQPLRVRFDDMIRTGEIDPAYALFARYQQRNRERMRAALARLQETPDFTVEETFEFDRENAAWPVSTTELDELWRKRVKNDAVSLMLTGKTWPEAADILRKRYERALKRVDQQSSEDAFETLMNAYARTFDPHSSYFSPRSSEEYRIQMSLNYEGIGASLQLVDEYVTVMNVIEGGPASVAGTLSVNDRITAVGQGPEGPLTDVIGWRIDDVVQLIRGKGGTNVRLQVLAGGAAPGSPEKVLQFARGKVTLEAQAASKEIKALRRGDRDLKVGVINVPGFYSDYEAQRAGNQDYRSTTRDVQRLIAELQKEKIDGLVIDLRGNGGGFLPEAQSLTGLFIDRGPVVQLKFASGDKEVLDDPVGGAMYGGPLAVLVDRFSASASEIFAGAIQDYRRGVVLGQRTFGKGTVQNLVPLSQWSARPVNGQLTVTIGKFYRVTGESTQHRGVEPDVPLASPIDLEEVGESALDDALPWDRIAGVPFRIEEGPAKLSIARLAMEEGSRAQRDPDYRWLVSDIAAVNVLRQQRTVSLSLKTRQSERARLEAERLARENLRRTQQNQPAAKSVEELDGKDAPDVVLVQASEVMADMVTGASPATPIPAVTAPAAPRSANQRRKTS